MRKFSWQRGAVGSVGVAPATGSGCVVCHVVPHPINGFDLLRDTTRRDTTCDLPLPTPVTTKPCLIPSFLPSFRRVAGSGSGSGSRSPPAASALCLSRHSPLSFLRSGAWQIRFGPVAFT